MATTRVVALVAVGAILWFLAALLIRAMQPLGALHAPGVVVTYALVAVGTAPIVWLTRRLVGAEETVFAVTLVTGTAALLDGNALVWIPALYGPDTAGAGAAILWGAGVALILGIVMGGRAA
jgi:hypothetical protein